MCVRLNVFHTYLYWLRNPGRRTHFLVPLVAERVESSRKNIFWFAFEPSPAHLAKTCFCPGFQKSELRIRQVHLHTDLLLRLLLQVKSCENFSVAGGEAS